MADMPAYAKLDLKHIKQETNTVYLSPGPVKNSLKNTVSSRSFRVVLEDWAMTTVHVVKYDRRYVQPQPILFETETALLEWCRQNEVNEAMSGGFFLRKISKPLGEMWLDGSRLDTAAFVSPYDKLRGSLYISRQGDTIVAPRNVLPHSPDGSMLQAGPLLVKDGRVLINDNIDPEGFSEGAAQFDDDISKGRFPRMAIGFDRDYIYAVSCDGRSSRDAGMSLRELAELLVRMGLEDALNLDGGSSSTLISGGRLLNKPRGGADHGNELFENGRPIYSAILFRMRKA